MERRALVVINRHCRQGQSDLSAIFDRFSQHGIAVESLYPTNPEQSSAQIRERAREFDLVVLGGGDGTLRSAAAAVFDSGLPLGVLPLGTANDLSRSLGVPADPLAAVDVIGEGVTHLIDLGRVNGYYFFNASNIGIGVSITKRLSHDRKQRWGVLGYLRSMIESWRDMHPFKAYIVCDGETRYVRSVQITVGNGRFYGGGMTVHETATIDDQLLDLYSIRPQSVWRFVGLLPAIRAGRHDQHEEVDTLRGKRIEVRTSRPRMITADGELVSRTPAVYEVVAAALPVYVRSETKPEGLQHAAQ